MRLCGMTAPAFRSLRLGPVLVGVVLLAAGCASSAAPADSEIRYCHSGWHRPLPLLEPAITARPEAPSDSLLYDWDALADAIEYNEFARRATIEGTVPLDVVIGGDGRLIASRVPVEELTQDSFELFVESTLLAVRRTPVASAPPYQTAARLLVRFRLR